MKTFAEIFEELLPENGNNVNSLYSYSDVRHFAEEVSEIFATQVAQDALNRAAENAEVVEFYFDGENNGQRVDVGFERKIYRPDHHVEAFKGGIRGTKIILP